MIGTIITILAVIAFILFIAYCLKFIFSCGILAIIIFFALLIYGVIVIIKLERK